MSALSHRGPFSVVTTQLGRLLRPEPFVPSPNDPKLLPAHLRPMTPDQLAQVHYGCGRTETKRSE